mgnify:FL=1
MKSFLTHSLILTSFFLRAQSIKIQIIDSLSSDPVPFATVHFSNNRGLITNEIGFFELLPGQVEVNDSLFVSSIGFERVAVGLKQFNDSIIYTQPKAIVLDDVILTNKNYTSEKIISLVQDRLNDNFHLDYSQKRLFIRELYGQNIIKVKVDKFKSSISELNRSLLDSILVNMPKKSDYIVETLCYYSSNFEGDNQKINLINARKTYDKGNDLMKSLTNRLERGLKENVKSDSYFKIRSGIFGSDMTIQGLEEEVDSTDLEALKTFEKKQLEKNKSNKEGFAKYRKSSIAELLSKLFFVGDPEINCIKKPNRYVFSEPKLTTEGNDLIYIIDFTPKRKEDFEGTLYVNSADFAITRLDFNNTKSLFRIKLLGILYDDYLKSGKMIFSKINEKNYGLSYLQISGGEKIRIDRPIKFIEKNKFVKGRKKQNQISMRLDLSLITNSNYEVRVFESKKLSQEEFDQIEEKNEVLPKYYKEFKTNFWEEF